MNLIKHIESKSLVVGLSAFFLLVGLSFAILVGCKSTSPVSTKTIVNNEKDSTSTTSIYKLDSSFYKETVDVKKLEGAKVGVRISRSQFDSLFLSLEKLPSNLPKQVLYTDAKAKAELKLAIDSLGNLFFECQAKDQYYFEKTIQQSHTIESLTKEVNRLREEKSFMRNEVVKSNRTLAEQFKSFRNIAFWLGLISTIIYLVFNFFILKRFKILKA